MRILMITQWFTPELNLVLPIAKGLSQLGHDVRVLTGFPNYPGGKVYPGYTIRPWQREEVEGLPVLRVALYPSHDQSALRRVANYASFALSSATIGLALSQPVDVVYVYHPPATVGLPAMFLRWLRQTPFVYHIQDLWPDTLSATGMVTSSRVLNWVEAWCQLVYKLADRVVVISPGFRQALMERGVPGEKVEVVYNWCPESDIRPMDKDTALAHQLGLDGRFNVIFAGTMGKAQALDAVLAAASLLEARFPSVQFVFIGGGIEVERLEQKVKDDGIQNVLFLPRRPISDMAPIFALADVLLVHLKDDPLFQITIPGKAQAYLAAGKPILMAVKGDAAALIEKAEAGLVCLPENPHSIAQAVERMVTLSPAQLACMGRNGRRFYENELALNMAVSRFESIFKACARLS